MINPNPLTPPETPNLINKLPEDVFLLTFGNLGVEDLKTVILVCKLWNKLGEELWVNIAEDRFQKDEYNFQDKWVVNRTHTIDERRFLQFGMFEKCALPNKLTKIVEMAASLEKYHEEFMKCVGDALIMYMVKITTQTTPSILKNAIIRSEPAQVPLKMDLHEFPCLEGYMNAPKYSFVYRNQGEVKKDPLVALQLYLIKELESVNPKVRKSAVKTFKKVALDFVLHGKEKTKSGANVLNHVYNSILRSILWVYLETSPDLKKAANEAIKIFQQNHLLIQDLACDMPPGEFKRALFQVLREYCIKFSKLLGKPINWKKSILCISHPRVLYAQQLLALAEKLRVISYCNDFEDNVEKFIKYSVRVLIASSHPKGITCLKRLTNLKKDITSSGFWKWFQQLEDYTSSYNDHFQSPRDVKKAAVLYIRRGLESENLDVKNAALKGLGILANDYLTHGHKGEAAEEYLAVIFRIAKYYVDAQAEADSKTMCETIISTFKANKEILQKFAKALPEGEKRSLLEEAVSLVNEIDLQLPRLIGFGQMNT